MARWRHLAPPQDTGHSVWVQEGLRGVEGVGTWVSTHPAPPTTTWETRAERVSMSISDSTPASSWSVLSFHPSIFSFFAYLNTLTYTCPQCAVTSITLLGVVYDGFFPPVSIFFSLQFSQPGKNTQRPYSHLTLTYIMDDPITSDSSKCRCECIQDASRTHITTDCC